MKALLIQPDYPLDHKYNPKNALLLPPLGLECIAAQVRDVAETRIVDNRLHGLSWIKEEIGKFRPDIVGISSCFSFGIEHALGLARIAKEQGAVTVLGGWHPSLLADDVLASPHVDIVVRSEGELSFRELVQRGSPVGVAGVSYKEGKRVIHNPDRSFADLDTLKLPSRDLRVNGSRHAYGFFGYPVDVVESSRGCPYNCTFCSIHRFYRRTYRHRSVTHVMNELREIRKRCRSVYLIDDNFVVNPGHVSRLCDEIIRERLNMVFMTTTRADTVVKHPELFKKMAEAGFILVFMGLENFSNASLEKLNKQLSFKQITAAIKILHDLGFIIQGNIILGAALSDTEADLERTIRVAKHLDVDITTFSLLTPFPGTELMERVQGEGLLLKEGGAWRDFNWVTPTIRYPHITPDRLATYHLKAYEEVPFFSHPGRRIVRILRARHFSFLIYRLANWETLRGVVLMLANSLHRFLNKRRRPAT
ncbi:MAG: B12-binding domain-containing radical SAM protein [Candidatus Lokiarchaeota archaeon]|nr:B12-binding domain-containing radical SAM protein [Candidatus Lokiarchaeota archaeon]